ncbi:hypothetical protein N7488_003333 [Penicillium malachiteum]|nr:hypothetical protein N7488_003333 [Penicillium malachiteum]
MFSDFMRQLWLAEQNVFSDNEADDPDAETDDSMAIESWETWVGLDEGLVLMLKFDTFAYGFEGVLVISQAAS